MSNRQHDLDRLVRFIKERIDCDFEVMEQTHLREDIGLDDLGVIDLVTGVEMAFGMPPVPNDEFGGIRTISDLLDRL